MAAWSDPNSSTINFPLEPTSRDLISVSSCPPSLPSAATDSQWMERTWQWTALLFDQNILYPLAPSKEDGSDLFRFYQADRRDYDNPELDYNHIISIYGEVPCSMYCVTLQGAKTACCLNGKNKASSFLSGSSNCPLPQHIFLLLCCAFMQCYTLHGLTFLFPFKQQDSPFVTLCFLM